MATEKLNELRRAIDAADRNLIDAFVRRMGIAAGIAEAKREMGKAVFDAGREAEKLDAVASLAGEEMANYTRTLYSLLFELSRDYQNRILGPGAEPIRVMDTAFPGTARVACQGRAGAYSEIAARTLFQEPDIAFYPTFESVMQAVAQGQVKYGVLPIENSNAGCVEAVYSLLNRYGVYIVREVKCSVRHSLLAKPGVRLEDICEVISHGQALSQCSEFLAAHPEIRVSYAENTAVAARMVAESDRRDLASLSSHRCAEIYHLEELARDVQNTDNNRTRFLCVSGDLEVYPDADKTSIILVTDNRPGALYKVLSRFFALGINLSSLVSQPIAGSNFESRFYLDFESPVLSDDFSSLISSAPSMCREFKYLGSYKEAE
ncbi:MAG: bifunctional chorismate mutase/prephenate dehydratase [Eubacteriales bacterium]